MSEQETWRSRLSRAFFGSQEQNETQHKRTDDGNSGQSSKLSSKTLEIKGNLTEPISIANPSRKDELSGTSSIDIPSSTTSSSPTSKASTSHTPSNKLKNFQAMLSTSIEDKISSLKPVAKDRVTVRSSDHHRRSSSDEHSSTNRMESPIRTPTGQSVHVNSHSREASGSDHNRSPSPRLPIISSFDNKHQRSLSQNSSRRSGELNSTERPILSLKDKETSSIIKTDDNQDAVAIPDQLQKGDVMLKVTSRKVMQRIVRIDAISGQILWGSKKNNCVNLESIREVRTGSDGRSYRNSLSIAASHEKRWISIIYQTNSIYKALHLIALSDDSFQCWKETLKDVQEERRLLSSSDDTMQKRRTSIWLRQQFTIADASKDARLDFDEIVRLCRRLGIMSNREDLRRGFDEADKEGLGYLDFAKFQRFVALLKRRTEVECIFDEWADLTVGSGKEMKEPQSSVSGLQDNSVHSTKLMSRSAFAKFIKLEQRILDVPERKLDEVFGKFSNNLNESNGGLNCDGFLAFLMSSDNAILSDQSSLALAAKADRELSAPSNFMNDEKRANAETAEDLIAISGQIRVTQDMTKPLPDYFISSSHNTYLVAGQLTGESTIEGYIRALMQGARSVELDCWDGPGNEPIVTHGHTLTSKVPLRDVIQAIGKYAFVASPYPLILSLEVHNDLAQQDSVAEILRTELGNKLLQYPLSNKDSTVLPSPQDLIGKILIKAKNLLLSKKADDPSQMELVVQDKAISSTTETTTTTESESDGLIQNARDLVRSVKSKGRRLSNRRSGQDESNPNVSGEKKQVMSTALSSLLIYTVGVKHRGINKKETYAIEHMISLSERTAHKYARNSSASGGLNGEDLIKHNRTHLTRIYPSMNTFARLNYSANFLPNIFWSLGCQLVALNWQTVDLGYEMNQAMFMRNGKSGFVLKPDALRKKDKSIFPDEMSSISFVNVTFTIISAQQLPRDRQGNSKQAIDANHPNKELDGTVLNPFISVMSVVPDTTSFSVKTIWKDSTSLKPTSSSVSERSQATSERQNVLERSNSVSSSSNSTTTKNRKNSSRARTSTIRRNGFNPIWNETIKFRFQIPTKSINEKKEDIQQYLRGLLDLCFVRFEVRNETKVDQPQANSSSSNSNMTSTQDLNNSQSLHKTTSNFSTSSTKEAPSNRSIEQEFSDDSPCLATFMISLGAMEQGYHHIPLYDSSMTQLLFSTLFVRTKMEIEEEKLT